MKVRRSQRGLADRWPARMLRGLRFDRNPLRRGTDRLETVITGALIATFAAGAPLAVPAAGSAEHTAAVREARVQRSLIRLVPATLLQTTSAWSSGADGAYPETPARWTAPDGKACTGWVFDPNGGEKGSTVTIWVSRSGQLSEPPLQPGQIRGRTQMAEEAAGAGLAAVLAMAWLLARRALARRRMAAWDAEWLAVGPLWGPRRR